MRRKRRYDKWLVHFIAKCQDCDWETQDYIHGPKEASRHAAKTGHYITAESAYAITYNKLKGGSDE